MQPHWRPEATLGLHLGHHGNPYPSDIFVVHGAFASMAARQKMADRAEQAYLELKTDLATGHPEFEWATEDRTIDIFTNTLQTVDSGLAYNEGFLAPSCDAQRSWWNADSARYDGLIKHELMHAVQGLLIGTTRSLSQELVVA